MVLRICALALCGPWAVDCVHRVDEIPLWGRANALAVVPFAEARVVVHHELWSEHENTRAGRAALATLAGASRGSGGE